MSLNDYREKRDFSKTSEPEAGKKSDSESIFVVQRHDARNLHYDLRLEMEGVLKSWAIPKGPSMNPADKRLAMQTEDHPFGYKDFEGEIPKGEYGAGSVEIWDAGKLTAPGNTNPDKAAKQLLNGLHNGHLKFELHGEKLQGGFALIKLKDEKQKNAWLLIKENDKFATDEPYNSETHIKPGSKIPPKDIEPSPLTAEQVQDLLKPIPAGAKKANIPEVFQPMLASLIDQPFSDKDWLFEIKWDGYRALAFVDKGTANLYSRNKLLFKKYIPLNKELERLQASAVIDGEIVVVDENGHADFQKMQHYSRKYEDRLQYQVFDLIYLNGHNLINVPLLERKKLLQRLVTGFNQIIYSDHIIEKGEEFYALAESHELEGIIGKLGAGPYRPGKRSPDWVKMKILKTQEAVVGGYTLPKSGRQYFGSLLLGVYDGKKFRFIGSSGGGFDQKMLKEVYGAMQPLRIENKPFANKVPVAKNAVWVKPELVCEVAFSEFTNDGIMRHPVFRGMRDDKNPREIVREIPQPGSVVKQEAKPVQNQNSKAGAAKNKSKIIVGKQAVSISNTNKVYWPEEGYTKGNLVEYYHKMAEYIVPYLKDRPQSLHRHPDGINGEAFYQKDMGTLPPSWIARYKVPRNSADADINYMLVQDAASLLWMVNLGCIEINPWSSRVQQPDHPDYVVIDIDPAQNTFEEVIEVALAVKEVLDEAAIAGYPKTSGATGMHIYIPLGAKHTYEQGKNFAHLIAYLTHRKLPKLTSIARMTKLRTKQVYLDYLQNNKGQTLASVYSVRPRPGATVSTPLKWEEVKSGLHPSQFTMKNLPARIEKTGDLFKGAIEKGIDLAKTLARLEKK
ncbi:MAG: DNA ligase D [Bacteroidia bacterium]